MIEDSKNVRLSPITQSPQLMNKSITNKMVLVLRFLIPAVVFCWPFIFLFPYIFPVKGQYLVIGNDFHILYYYYKAYLLDNLSRFQLPLWSPSEAAGFPFYSSPFTQTFYPLNILLVAFYKFAGGYQVLDHQRFTVLGISIFSLGLFYWLKSLKLNLRSVLFATFVMSVSFKVTEILRFPNAIHTAAWYPWILFIITRLADCKSNKDYVKYGLFLAFVLVCLFTGGYLYYIYYSVLLFGPYLVIILFPRLRERVLDSQPVELKRFIFALLITGLTALAICALYLYKISFLMKQTTDRGGNNFEYSTAHIFNYLDTIGSWIFPPAAQTEGWYYFGMTSVFLILLYFFNGQHHPVLNNLTPLPKSRGILTGYSDIWIKVFFLLWIGAISYITYGRYSYLFRFLWEHVPFFSSLRAWGRMNIILVPIIAWLVAVAYQYFESVICGKEFHRTPLGWSKLRSLAVLSAIFTSILVIQLYIWTHNLYDDYWNTSFVTGVYNGGQLSALMDYAYLLGLNSQLTPEILITFAEGAPIIFGVVAFGILFILLLLVPKYQPNWSRFKLDVLLVGLIALSALDVAIVGPWAWAWTLSPTSDQIRLDIDQQNLKSFAFPRRDYAEISLTASFNIAIMPNWYFNRYVAFLKKAELEPDATERLLGVVDGRKLYFSKAIDYLTIRAFLNDAERFTDFEQVFSYTGDKLTVKVRSSTDGYLSFIDNWDPDWEAFVDGKSTEIQLLFGTFKSVRLSAGEHIVTFAYRPKFLFLQPQD